MNEFYENYQKLGFNSRLEYLQSLAEEYDVDLDKVLATAVLLGPEEDFDGLLVMLQDMVF